MPDLQAVAAGRNFGESRSAVGTGFRKPRGVEDDDISDHPIVDIAPECHDAGLVKHDGFLRPAGVERFFKTLGLRQRVKVMLDVVAVGERDAGAGQNVPRSAS